MRLAGLVIFLFSTLLLQAQQTLSISSYDPVPPIWLKLLEDKQVISDDDILNEQLIDLVDCFTTDSVYKRKTERHQFFWGRNVSSFWCQVAYNRLHA